MENTITQKVPISVIVFLQEKGCQIAHFEAECKDIPQTKNQPL
ncbi:hypothetical protein SC499_23175 [Peribacillus simplex]|nr:hypothetical protein [Peribacillus simplex]MDW7617499.1 hypothetical protein [Peribacillus simplex]